MPTEFLNSQGSVHLQLVAADVDSDGAVIDYSAADYRLVFSEPIVLAALAAQPTRAGIGQNAGGSFGLFTYVRRVVGEQQFQVVNYWVQ